MYMSVRTFQRTLLFWMAFALLQGIMLGASLDELAHLAGWIT